MIDFEFVERKPTAEELLDIRKAVGLKIRDKESMEIGLSNSLYGICVIGNGRVIGTARVVGDGKTCFYIHDVMIYPKYQGMGIGLKIMDRIMNYISKNACSGAIVGLMAAKGKEEFYEKFGFMKRPYDNYGYGMSQFWE